jgi:hypothetical protein
MDNDDERLLERMVRRSSTAEPGRIPEFLTEKKAEQQPKPGGYRTSLEFRRTKSGNTHILRRQ